jgi:hypothetical protein
MKRCVVFSSSRRSFGEHLRAWPSIPSRGRGWGGVGWVGEGEGDSMEERFGFGLPQREELHGPYSFTRSCMCACSGGDPILSHRCGGRRYACTTQLGTLLRVCICSAFSCFAFVSWTDTSLRDMQAFLTSPPPPGLHEALMSCHFRLCVGMESVWSVTMIKRLNYTRRQRNKVGHERARSCVRVQARGTHSHAWRIGGAVPEIHPLRSYCLFALFRFRCFVFVRSRVQAWLTPNTTLLNFMHHRLEANMILKRHLK